MHLDIHGLTENEAITTVNSFLWEFSESNLSKCEIVTGNGIVLKDTTIEIVEENGFRWTYDGANKGCLLIYK